MGNYYNDQPITGDEDNPDLLSRGNFADHLASVLRIAPSDDCMIVSLESEWGFGKTSVINLVKQSLKTANQNLIIIEYNPWLAGEARALVQDFLLQFSSQLNIPDRQKESLKAAEELLAYSEFFNTMKFVPGVEPWASTVQGVFKKLGGTTKRIGKLKELDLLGRKNKIKEVLKSLGVSIIVIIDDIDRLTPDEAFQVVRLVKAVADFPGTSFLLPFDPVYLASSLAKHGIEKSNQYIDKVVQLRVPLPLIAHRDFQKLVDIEFQNLSDISLTEKFERDQERLSDLYYRYVKYLIRSPRELKRIFNHLRFVLVQTEGEVCFTDLYCLSVLAIKSEKIYQSLKESPEYYVGRKLDGSIAFEKSKVVKDNESKRKALLQELAAKDVSHIEELLKELFPLLGDLTYSIPESYYDQCGRVASEKRLYIALHYQVPVGYASDTDIMSFLNGTINREKYIRTAIEEDFIERLLELLNHNIKKIIPENARSILVSIYTVFFNSAYLKDFEDAMPGFLGFTPYRRIVSLTFEVIKSLDDKENLLFDLVKEPQFLPITVEICRMLMIQEEEIKTDDPRLTEEKWLSKERNKNYLESWSKTVLEELEKGQLIGSIYVSYIYPVLYRAAQGKTRELFDKWLNEDAGIEKIAKLVGRSGNDSIKGPYSKISEEELSELLDFEKLKKLAESELSNSSKNLSTDLKAVYSSIVKGGKYYLKDGKKADASNPTIFN